MNMSLPKTIHFITGMPRSGSTLLCNILAQNPRFGVTATSGILDMLLNTVAAWEKAESFKSAPHETNQLKKKNTLGGMLRGYFDDDEHPVVFDKSRGWIAYRELAEQLLDRPVKMLVTVRDVRAVLSSFEKIWRKNRGIRPTAHELQHPVKFQYVEGRCSLLMQPDQVVGIAYKRIEDALLCHGRENLLFVPFNRLTKNPAAMMAEIYSFLGETPFQHDFNNVAQVTQEDDTLIGMNGLHDIRPKVEPVEDDFNAVLGPIAAKWQGPFAWSAALKEQGLSD